MSCQRDNCYTEDQIQSLFEKISRRTGLCFPAINTSFVPAGTTVSTGFLIQGGGIGYLDQQGGSRILLSISGGSTRPFKAC